jgi:hypothetical protein
VRIELTEQQTSILKQGYPVRIPAEQLGGDLILLLAAPQESVAQVLQEALDDIRLQQGWQKVTAQAQAEWAKENPS